MKKIIIFAIILLALLSSVHARTLYGNVADIRVTLHSQSPDPVEPGQVVTVKFKVENSGKEMVEDVVINFIPTYPFELYGDVAEKNIGRLKGASVGTDAIIVEYKLKVDEEAVEGDNEIELHLDIGDTEWIDYDDDDFMINVQTHDAVLEITSITFEPEQIPPGGTSTANIMVRNSADSLLKDIKFTLDFRGDAVPLAPYQSSSQQRLAQLRSDYQGSLKFNIIADPDATPGLYKVPLNTTYNDENGNNYEVDDVLAVTVGDIPDINVHIKKSTVLQSNKDGKITLEIANAGTTDVKFLELVILQSEDYRLISTSDYFYIGDVDADDTESEEIDIHTNNWIKNLHVPVELKYNDANNKPYQQKFDLELKLYSARQLRKYGVIERTKSGLYGILLVLGGGGYLIYRRYKKE